MGTSRELTKIHHACIDGVAGAEILGVLLDIEPEPAPTPPPAEPWQWERDPTSAEMLARGVIGAVTRPRVGLRIAARHRSGARIDHAQLRGEARRA